MNDPRTLPQRLNKLPKVLALRERVYTQEPRGQAGYQAWRMRLGRVNRWLRRHGFNG